MELTPAQLAEIRNAVLAARKQGMQDPEIDAELRQRVGVSLADVAKMTPLDVGRSLAEGATLGHSDELGAGIKSGLLPAVLANLAVPGAGSRFMRPGHDYTATRDSLRAQAAASHDMNPGKTTLLELGGGVLPAAALSMLPGGAAPAAAGWLPKAAAAAKVAGLSGALLGEGKSTADAPEDIAMDAAKTGAFSALLGGGLSAAGSAVGAGAGMVRDFRDPAGAAMRRGAPLMPNNAPEIAAQQEAAAPGTVVAADMSPELSSSVAGVGADAATGVAARAAAEQRLAALQHTRQMIGQQYEQLKTPVAITKDVRALLAKVGKSKLLPKEGNSEITDVLGEWAAPGAKEVEASAVHKIRSELLSKARKAARAGDGARAHDLRDAAAGLTDWLQKQVPEIRTIDRDYSFISSRLAAAQKTLKEIVNSNRSFTRQAVGGVEAASAGGSLPKATAGLFDAASKLMKPSRATTAAGANEALLTPVGPDYLQKMLRMKQLLGAPPGPAANIMRASLFGDAAPQAAQFGSQFFPQPPQQ